MQQTKDQQFNTDINDSHKIVAVFPIDIGDTLITFSHGCCTTSAETIIFHARGSVDKVWYFLE